MTTLRNSSLEDTIVVYDGFATRTANETLSHLYLNNNAIGTAGALHLAAMVQTNKSLIVLDLSYNSMGEEGSIAIAAAIGSNAKCVLREFNFAYNCTRDGGAIALATALRDNTNIDNLNLSANSIGESGMVALLEMMRVNCAIQILDISLNPTNSPLAVATLGMALQENQHLETLDMTGNALGHAFLETVSPPLVGIGDTKQSAQWLCYGLDRVSSNFKSLSLSRNQINIRGTKALLADLVWRQLNVSDIFVLLASVDKPAGPMISWWYGYLCYVS